MGSERFADSGALKNERPHLLIQVNFFVDV
jgi:hypothetical protein